MAVPNMTAIHLVAATVVVVAAAATRVVVVANSRVYIHVYLSELHVILSSRNIIRVISWRRMNLIKNVVVCQG
jgi:hypothetical protein